jgi:hypothetical protein
MTLPLDPDPAACAMLRALAHDAVLGAHRTLKPRVQRFHGYAVRCRPLAPDRIEVVIAQGHTLIERAVVALRHRADGR